MNHMGSHRKVGAHYYFHHKPTLPAGDVKEHWKLHRENKKQKSPHLLSLKVRGQPSNAKTGTRFFSLKGRAHGWSPWRPSSILGGTTKTCTSVTPHKETHALKKNLHNRADANLHLSSGRVNLNLKPPSSSGQDIRFSTWKGEFNPLWGYATKQGELTERLGNGLQNRQNGFNSRVRLHAFRDSTHHPTVREGKSDQRRRKAPTRYSSTDTAVPYEGKEWEFESLYRDPPPIRGALLARAARLWI